MRSLGLEEQLQAMRQVEYSKLIVVRIEEMRCERGMSIAELGRRSLIDHKRLWYILDGQREMRVEEFLKLCVVLKIDPRSFVTRDMVNGIAEAAARSIDRAQH